MDVLVKMTAYCPEGPSWADLSHSLRSKQNRERRNYKKLNHLLWVFHDNKSDRMDIYHFTDTKDIWHVNSSKANQWLPRIQCNPSDILYVCLINLVSDFYGISVQKAGRKQIAKKHYLPCAPVVRKKQSKAWYPPSSIYNYFSMFPHNCFNSREGGKCHFWTIALVVLDYFPWSLSKDSCFVGSRSSYPGSLRNHLLKRLITEPDRRGSEACTALLNRQHLVQKGSTGIQFGFPDSY